MLKGVLEPSDYRMEVVSQALLHLCKTATDKEPRLLAQLAGRYHLKVCAEDSDFEELARDEHLLALTALAMERYPVPSTTEAFSVASDCVEINNYLAEALKGIQTQRECSREAVLQTRDKGWYFCLMRTCLSDEEIKALEEAQDESNS